MQRRSAKNRHSNGRTPAETKIREPSGRKSPQKRAIRRRAGNVRFAETGWWVVEVVGHKLVTHHPVIEPVSAAECQSACKFDPVSASNFAPFERRVLAVALAP